MAVQSGSGDAGILDVIEGNRVNARGNQRGDAVAERIKQAIRRDQRGAVLRVSADEEQGFVKADERFGAVEFAPADLGQQGGDAPARRAEVALRFVEPVEQLSERFLGHRSGLDEIPPAHHFERHG